LGGQKLCAFHQKYGSFWVKKIVHLFVRFLAKLGAPLSSELLDTLGFLLVPPSSCNKFYSLQEERKIFCTWTEFILDFIFEENPAILPHTCSAPI